MTVRLKCVLRYDGSSYHGWQVQPNALTVQQVVGEAFFQLLGHPVDLTGCSRTDTGVHAREFVFHTDLSLSFPPQRLPVALQAFLPPSVRLISAQQVEDSFHARYSVRQKTYRYYISLSPVSDPFLYRRALHWPKRLNVADFCLGAGAFVGRRDFSSCMAAGSKITDPVRTVSACRAWQEGELLCLEITADGFLYNMVRIIVGTLLQYAGDGDKMDLGAVLEAKDRSRAGFTAPPDGLYLWKVEY